MQKVVRFLEANVEWFALLIAVGFLGYTIWTYFVKSPISAELEGQTVTPANIESVIEDGPAKRLGDAMKEAQPPDFHVDDFASAIDRGLSLEGQEPPQLAESDFDYSPLDIGAAAGPSAGLGVTVTQLPVLPAAKGLLIAAGLDTLAPPAANGAAPAANPPGQPAPPADEVPQGKDVRIIVAAFTIPWAQFSEQWNKCFGPVGPNGPPRLPDAEVQFLAVTAYRSEQLADGQWSSDVEIPGLETGLPPYPAANDKPAQESYLIAVNKQPTAIVSPEIPAVSFGAVWKDPLQLLPTATNPPGNAAGGGDQSNGTIWQSSGRLARVDVQYQRGGGGGFPGMPPGGPGGMQPNRLPPRPSPSPDQQPAEPSTPTAQPPAPGTAAPIVNVVSAIPTPTPVEPPSKLNPIGMPPNSPDLCIYLVDQTAASGKTYRYRIVYKLYNPLFNGLPERVANKKWIDQFDLVSPPSEYSPSITVPQQTYVYCSNSQGARSGSFPFDVITWAKGQWRRETFSVSPGDPIGGVDGNVDFSTGWIYADKRATSESPPKVFITLVDAIHGDADIRDVYRDASSADHREKDQWVNQQTAQQPNANPAAPTIPNPGQAPPPPPAGFVQPNNNN
jgi:hypothetical protein